MSRLTTPRPAPQEWRVVPRICQLLGAGAIALFALVAFTPLANLLAETLSVAAVVAPADAVIVLAAGASRGGVMNNMSLRRAVHGVALHQDGWAPLLVLSGGGRGEGGARAALARRLKVPAESILTVASGHTTREESMQMARILKPRGVRKILLVTDVQHMPRAQALFERVGFQVLPAPVLDGSGPAERPQGRLDLFYRTLQELLALQYYRLAGYL
jgi:uncharacterized SAM-binding protein YcdF (DUF218 family)